MSKARTVFILAPASDTIKLISFKLMTFPSTIDLVHILFSSLKYDDQKIL